MFEVARLVKACEEQHVKCLAPPAKPIQEHVRIVGCTSHAVFDPVKGWVLSKEGSHPKDTWSKNDLLAFMGSPSYLTRYSQMFPPNSGTSP